MVSHLRHNICAHSKGVQCIMKALTYRYMYITFNSFSVLYRLRRV